MRRPPVLAALAALVLVAGCGGDPKPTPIARPTASPSPSASASATPPALPAAAKTKSGAIAFAKTFVDGELLGKCWRHPAPLRALVRPVLHSCEALADADRPDVRRRRQRSRAAPGRQRARVQRDQEQCRRWSMGWSSYDGAVLDPELERPGRRRSRPAKAQSQGIQPSLVLAANGWSVWSARAAHPAAMPSHLTALLVGHCIAANGLHAVEAQWLTGTCPADETTDVYEVNSTRLRRELHLVHPASNGAIPAAAARTRPGRPSRTARRIHALQDKSSIGFGRCPPPATTEALVCSVTAAPAAVTAGHRGDGAGRVPADPTPPPEVAQPAGEQDADQLRHDLLHRCPAPDPQPHLAGAAGAAGDPAEPVRVGARRRDDRDHGNAGAPYPAKDVVYRYSDAHRTVDHRVVVTWSARWSLNGGALQPVDGTVTTSGPATPLRIAEASPALSGEGH